MTFMTHEERMQRESKLIATIRTKLPDFARMCADDAEHVLLHQDAFAADYQEDEYMLLGMAIKYAGLRGKEVRLIGTLRALSAKAKGTMADSRAVGIGGSTETLPFFVETTFVCFHMFSNGF